MIHPVMSYDVENLLTLLNERVAVGDITGRPHPRKPNLVIYNYTHAVLKLKAHQWDEILRMARGLVIDVEKKRVLSMPFPKFFNFHETRDGLLDLPFMAFEKMDGCLGIVFHDGEEWLATTRGSFNSVQAGVATRILASMDTSGLVPGSTYLFEVIGPETKIVVRYPKTEFVALGGYHPDGAEMTWNEVENFASSLGVRRARVFPFSSAKEMLEICSNLPRSEEGFVARYSNGLRQKFKGKEYLTAHRLISMCTPITVWEMIYKYPEKVDSFRSELPDEFLEDFDAIYRIITRNISDFESGIRSAAEKVSHMSNKELGIAIPIGDLGISENDQKMIFPWRSMGTNWLSHADTRRAVFSRFYPTANILHGYTPGTEITRMMESANES